MADFRAQRDAALVILEGQRPAPERVAAADELCELAAEHLDSEEEFSAALVKLLADAQPEVRARGLELACLLLSPREAADLCAVRLGDDSDVVRLEAAGRLADLAIPEARGYLARALQDPVKAIQFEAARGMAALHHSAGLEVLVAALDDGALRFRALGSLAELNDPRALPAVRRIFDKWLLPPFEKTQAAGVMARLGAEEGATYLFRRVKKRWTQDRALALEILGEVQAAGAYEVLHACLVDPKDTCRGAAARGLGRLRDLRAAESLRAVLADTTLGEDLRLDAAEGLLHLRDEASRAAVQAAASTFTTAEGAAELAELLEGAAESEP